METPTPAWWPQVAAAAGHRRHVTGQLLDHATVHLHDGTLQLTFDRPDIEQAWQTSRAQEALEGALEEHGIDVRVEVSAPLTTA